MTTISLKNYLQQINHLIDEGKFDDAISHSRHILESYPRNIEVYKLMGKAHLELRNHDEAIDLFQRVLSADPNDLVAHIGLSMIHKERGDEQLALWHLERAFEIQPYNQAIREELRLLYIRFNDEVPPRLPLTPGAVARLYIRGELYQQAVQTLEPVVSTAQDRLDLEVLLAEALWQGRDDQRIDAEQVCLNVLERLPNSVMANAILATIWLRTGRIGESQKYLARVQDLACLDRTSLDAETPIGRAFLTDGAPALPQEITLEWLDTMPAPQQVQLSSADWMNEMDAELGGDAPVDEAKGEVVQEGESGMHSYDWMMDVEDPGDAVAGAVAAGAVMSDWFAEGDEDVESGSLPQTGEEEVVPGWLGDLSDDEPVKTGHTDELDYSFLESESDVSEEAEEADWFASASITSDISESNALIDSEVPDWLSGVEEDELEDEAGAQRDDSDGEVPSEMPDWLAGETGDLELAADTGSPDWLGASLREELDPLQLNSYEAEGWLDEPAEAGANMIHDSEMQESEDDFAFLNVPSDASGGDDDWLSGLDDDSADDDLFAFDSEPSGADSGESDWLAASAGSEADAGLESNWLTADEEFGAEDTAVSSSDADNDWLFADRDDTPSADAEDAARESVTGWLSEFDEDDGGLGDLAKAGPAPVDSVPDEDWLNETTLFDTQGESSEVMDSVTNWLSDLEAENEIEARGESETSLADDELDDDWLKETSLLENAPEIAAAAAVTGWLSDFEEDDEEEDVPAEAASGLDDLFAADEVTPADADEEADDWLAELPELEDPQVAGELGTNWLTEDSGIAKSAVASGAAAEDDDADDMFSLTEDDSAGDNADDWLSVLTQDTFDTGELDEITPEAISEYESELDLEDDTEEDWSSLMYGTDSLGASPLEETGSLPDSGFSEMALSDEDLQGSQHDEIPDWLMTGPLDLDETPAKREVEHPGDALDEDVQFDSTSSELDWEEDQALDWITDLSESEAGGSILGGEDEEAELTPDLADFGTDELELDSEFFSTNELLGFDQADVPDWMEQDAAAERVSEEGTGFTGLFDLEEDDEPETAVSAASTEEEVGLTGMLGWDAGDEDDEAEDALSVDVPLDEEVGLTDLLGWDELETAVPAESGEEPSATDLFSDSDLFGEDDLLAADSDDDLTSLLAGTSLGQSSGLDMDDDTVRPTKSQAEFELDLPELLSGEETSWLDELDAAESGGDRKSGEESKITLDWLTQPEDTPVEPLDFGLDEAELAAPDEEDMEGEFKTEEVDIGEDAYPQDINDAISWLEDLAVQQEAPVEELPTIAKDVLEDEDGNEAEASDALLDWLADEEPIATATPALEEFIDDEDAVAPLDSGVLDEADSAVSWLDAFADEDEEAEADEGIEDFALDDALGDALDDFSDEAVDEADTFTGMEAELDDAISWLDEMAAEPDDEALPASPMDFAAEEPDLFAAMDEEEDPELAEDLDWLEQQVLSEGISIATPAVTAVAVSDSDLDAALDWLEVQLSSPAAQVSVEEFDDAADEPGAILLEEDLEAEEFPDAEMLTGPLEEDSALFDLPDDPEAALAWLESMGDGEDEFAVEMEPPLTPSEDAVYGDENLYGSLDELEEEEEDIFADLDLVETETAVDEAVAEDEEMADLFGDLPELDEDDPEAMFAALLAGDIFDIEMEPPPIKPSADAMYVDESLYASSRKPAEVEEEEVEEVVDEWETAVAEEPAAADEMTELSTEEVLDDLPELDEDDPEAMFAALLAGDIFDIEMEPPPIKPSADAMYVDESLYASSRKPAEVEEEEVEEIVDEWEMAVAEDPAAADEMTELSTEEVLDDLPELDEDDPEAMFAALLAGDIFDIEMEPPPIKPSADAVYVDESLYGSAAKTEEATEEIPEEQELFAEADVSADLDDLLDVPDDPDEAVAWLEAMASSDEALDVESDLPPIKPSADAMYVDESLYAAGDTAVTNTTAEDVPDDPDEAVAWLEKMAGQQGMEDQLSADDEVDLDEELMPAWMLTDTDDLDALLDDAPLEELGPSPDATPDEILNSSLGSPIDKDVHDALPSWLEVDEQEPPVGAETGWLRTLADLDVDSWLAAEEEATVRGFDEPTPLPLTSELSPTLSTTAELGGGMETEPDLFDTDSLEQDEFLVIEPDSSVSMYSIDEDELKAAQNALAAGKIEEAVAKYNELVSRGGGIMVLIAELEEVAETHNEQPEFRRLLGDAYMRNGQLQKALDTYKEALNHL